MRNRELIGDVTLPNLFSAALASVDAFFLVAYALWLFVGIAGTTAFLAPLISPYFAPIKLLSFSLLILHELTGMKTNRVGGIIGALLLFVLGPLSLTGGKVTLFETIIFAFCARNVSFIRICKVTLSIEVPLVAFSVLGALSGMVPNYAFWDGFSFHYALGFLSLSYLAHFLFNISIALSQIRINRVFLKFLFIIAMPVFVAVYRQTDSRVSFAVCIAFSCYMIFRESIDRLARNHRIVLGTFLAIQIALPIISVLTMVCYDPSSSFWVELDQLLSHRLQLANQAYAKYGIGLLGLDIEWVGWGLTYAGDKPIGEYNFVDCAYLRILFDYGMIVFIGFVTLSAALCIVLYKRERYDVLIAYILTSASLFIDSQSLQIQFNVLLLLIGTLFARHSGEKNVKND